MFCPQCGALNVADAVQCSECGASLNARPVPPHHDDDYDAENEEQYEAEQYDHLTDEGEQYEELPAEEPPQREGRPLRLIAFVIFVVCLVAGAVVAKFLTSSDYQRRLSRLALEEGGIDISQESFVRRVFAGDLPRVRRFLELDFDSTAPDARGWTPLYAALASGFIDAQKLFIKSGASVEPPSIRRYLEKQPDPGRELVDPALSTQPEIVVRNCLRADTPPITVAAVYGQTSTITFLASQGADVRQLTSSEWTPVMCAVAAAQPRAVDTLISLGANFEASAPDGLNPLLLAAQSENSDLLTVVLRAHPNLAIRGVHQRTALHYAALKQLSENVKLLLGAGADPNLTDDRNRTPIFDAIDNKDEETVNTLIEAKADLHVRDADGQTPLMFAAKGAPQSLLNKLRAATSGDTETTGATATEAMTPDKQLLFAITEHNLKQVDLAIERGARLDAADKDGVTALLAAVSAGQPHLLRTYLTGLTLDPSLTGRSSGPSRLFAAPDAATHSLLVSRGNPPKLDPTPADVEIVRNLLRRNIDANRQDPDSNPPLLYAVHVGNRDIIKSLLDGGADYQFINSRGISPLLYAVLTNRADLADQMLKSRRANTTDPRLPTVLFAALATAQPTVVRQLLEQGAPSHIEDPSGRSLLILAVQARQFELAKVLIVAYGETATYKDHALRAVYSNAVRNSDNDTIMFITRNFGMPPADLERAESASSAAPATASRGVRPQTSPKPVHTLTSEVNVPANSGKIYAPRYFDIETRDKVDTAVNPEHAPVFSFGPLQDAADEGNLAKVKDLVESGKVSVNARGSSGWTALMLASRRGHIDIVRYLLQKGADPRLQNMHHQTAKEWAESGHFIDIVSLLEDAERKSR